MQVSLDLIIRRVENAENGDREIGQEIKGSNTEDWNTVGGKFKKKRACLLI